MPSRPKNTKTAGIIIIPDRSAEPGTAAPNRFYMYGVVARLALLAASIELERTDPEMQG